MWRWIIRRRGAIAAAVTMGTCLQAANCVQEAQLTAVRIAFSSVSLPFNQLLIGLFGFTNALLSSAIATLITGT